MGNHKLGYECVRIEQPVGRRHLFWFRWQVTARIAALADGMSVGGVSSLVNKWLVRWANVYPQLTKSQTIFRIMVEVVGRNRRVFKRVNHNGCNFYVQEA